MKPPKPPKDLSKEAAAIWQQLSDEYDICDPGGLQLLKVYCESYDRATRCRKQIDSEGEQIRDRFGVGKAHPLLGPERDAKNQMMQALRALNLDLEPLKERAGRPSGGLGR